ncbi:unnamed protein product [Sympodiomycopsis kandeliae]
MSAAQEPRASRLAPTPIIPSSAAPTPTATQRPRASSHSSHGSDSSHSSHSSVQARKREEAFGTSQLPSVAKPAWSLLAVLFVLTLCHTAGLYLFTSGFLLTRTEVKGVSQCGSSGGVPTSIPSSTADTETLLQWGQDTSHQCSLPPAFQRSVLLIIDALRYDFIAPPQHEANFTPSQFYHGHLDLPARLAQQHPESSLLAHFLSDAPTTTLQRLKGLTTGNLPTFIDAGSNFGAEAIAEDNWITQYRNHISNQSGLTQPSMAFMGDDTWMKVFPQGFDPSWTWPFDSFNVEDLHTVDDGVRKHLLPFLNSPHGDLDSWKLIVAHTLGLDHVGHRHTPSHPLMTAKLQQMNTFVTEVVDALPPHTLFILAGDHGMDAQGDHGGHGELEVGSGIWLYSKDGFSASSRGHISKEWNEFNKDIESLRSTVATEPDHLFGPAAHTTFSPMGPTSQHRSIPQVDLVPSISLLLGIPLPFGSLGTIVPELFPPGETAASPSSSRLLSALRINSGQIRLFLQEYSKSSNEFGSFSDELESQYVEALQADAQASRILAARGQDDEEYFVLRRAALVAYQKYNRLALNRAKSLWTAFSYGKIFLGLVSLSVSIFATWQIISVIRAEAYQGGIVGFLGNLTPAFMKGTLIAAIIGFVVFFAVSSVPATHPITAALKGCSWVDVLVSATLGGSLSVAVSAGAYKISQAEQIKSAYQAGSEASSSVAKTKQEKNRKAKKTNPAQIPAVAESAEKKTKSPAMGDLLALSPVLLHALIFASNSLTVWEDSIVHALLTVVLVWRAWTGWSLGSQLCTENVVSSTGSTSTGALENTRAIAQRARQRVPFLLGLSTVLLRLVKTIGVCREEQAPSCTESVFQLRTLSSLLDSHTDLNITSIKAWLPTLAILGMCYLSSYILPSLLQQSLRQSKSDTSLVKFWSDWIFRPTLMLGSGWWVIDWIGEALVTRQDTVAMSADGGAKSAIQWGKNLIARADFALILVIGLTVWFFAPLCLEVKEEPQPQPQPQPQSQGVGTTPPSPPMTSADVQSSTQRRVQLLGFSNVFGSSYLLLFTLLFSLIWIVSPPMAQLTLCASFIIILSLSEAGDSERDLLALSRLSLQPSTLLTRTPQLLEVSTLYLLSHQLFFLTGHQATFASIQWRSAFIGFSALTYPWAPTLVILNTFGPFLLLIPISLPLLLSWNLPPTTRGPNSRAMKTFQSLLLASLYLILLFSITALSSAIFATHFRRHLMLFKIWAPRYMLAAVALIGVDAVVLVGAAAWSIIASKVAQSLGTEFE